MANKKKEHKEAEFIIKSVIESLKFIVEDYDGEDITCYFATALDEPIMSLIKARSFMAIADAINNPELTNCKQFEYLLSPL